MDANELRRQYIRRLADSSNVAQEARDLADELFSLDLTVYSKNFSLKSVIYNSLSVSSLDPAVSLHPDQLEIIERMRHHEALIVSAPTSFGKTFCIFEYIARYQPLNIVLVVPTLALVDEYMKKVIKKYQTAFGDYQVFTSIDIDLEYDFSKHNLFILTHDRITQTDAYSKIKRIDFLVIDEVYKLETDKANDRVLVLNMAYYRLSKIAKKYVLLAPFLGGIADLEQLEKKPDFYRSDYSPVVNEIKEIDIITEKDRDLECNRVVQSLDQNEKTLIYFPSVSGMNKYIRETISKLPDADDITETVARFMAWAKEEIHEEWSVVKAMEKGYLVHNGQIPRGTRQFQLSQYENDGGFNKLLCTSTLLEGVNTRARNIVIEKAARGSRRSDNQFKAFDFYNLVGRTGRLNQNLIGTAYYLKGPHDPSYRMQDAVKIIRFELTDDSVDIDIQTEELCERPEVWEFLNCLGITLEDYIKNIGTHFRFETIRQLYGAYCEKRNELICELDCLMENKTRGRVYLVRILEQIFNSSSRSFYAPIINNLLDLRRPRLRAVIDNVSKFSKAPLDLIISTAIRFKYSYVEHEFYKKAKVIEYFLLIENYLKQREKMVEKVIHPIDVLYFISSPAKKMMLDLGIYERDIDKIARIIGEDFSDARQLIEALKMNRQ